MKTDYMSRVFAFAASLTLAVLATVGVALSMSSTGQSGLETAQFASRQMSPVAADNTVVLEKTIVVGSRQSLLTWKAADARPATPTASRQVM